MSEPAVSKDLQQTDGCVTVGTGAANQKDRGGHSGCLPLWQPPWDQTQPHSQGSWSSQDCSRLGEAQKESL